MSSSIGSVTQLVTVIRAELSARTGAKAATAPGATRGRARDAGARYAGENLAALIGMRVRQIARDDPQRGRKAFTVFLEAVLVSHFGEQMVSDPQFYRVLDDVQGAMEADPACAVLVADAIEHLLSQHG